MPLSCVLFLFLLAFKYGTVCVLVKIQMYSMLCACFVGFIRHVLQCTINLKSVVLCLQVPLDPEILYISHALLVKMFDWGFQFLEWAFVFFPPSRVPFREKKDVKQ